jgi:hypothetical protein
MRFMATNIPFDSVNLRHRLEYPSGKEKCGRYRVWPPAKWLHISVMKGQSLRKAGQSRSGGVPTP